MSSNQPVETLLQLTIVVTLFVIKRNDARPHSVFHLYHISFSGTNNGMELRDKETTTQVPIESQSKKVLSNSNSKSKKNRSLQRKVVKTTEESESGEVSKSQSSSSSEQLSSSLAVSCQEHNDIEVSTSRGQSTKIIDNDEMLTLEELVKRISVGDILLERDFMLAYRTFFTPEMFFGEILRVFQSETKTVGKLRCIHLVRLWIEEYWSDYVISFQVLTPLMETLCEYASKNFPKLASPLNNLRSMSYSRYADQYSKTPYIRGQPPESLISDTIAFVPENQLNLIDFESAEIARQITLLDCSYWYKVKSYELLDQSWTKESTSPNLSKLINRFNHMNEWVRYEILIVLNLRKRIKILQKFIDISQCLLDLNNINGAFQVMSALMSAPISRLRRTFSGLTSKHTNTFKKLEDIFSPNDNYKNLRERHSIADPPAIPYVGLFLSDLTFIDEGNENFLKDKHVNMYKLRLIGKAIATMMRFQSIGYNFKQVKPIQNYLEKERTMLDEQLQFEVSQYIEPREPHTGSNPIPSGLLALFPDLEDSPELSRSPSNTSVNGGTTNGIGNVNGNGNGSGGSGRDLSTMRRAIRSFSRGTSPQKRRKDDSRSSSPIIDSQSTSTSISEVTFEEFQQEQARLYEQLEKLKTSQEIEMKNLKMKHEQDMQALMTRLDNEKLSSSKKIADMKHRLLESEISHRQEVSSIKDALLHEINTMKQRLGEPELTISDITKLLPQPIKASESESLPTTPNLKRKHTRHSSDDTKKKNHESSSSDGGSSTRPKSSKPARSVPKKSKQDRGGNILAQSHSPSTKFGIIKDNEDEPSLDDNNMKHPVPPHNHEIRSIHPLLADKISWHPSYPKREIKQPNENLKTVLQQT
eukprot:TRINITY_DN493_c0_g1_i1.p1 TRINITY_DN493_c0_g1~~TRINITY_DN493_c0_g1_i1.p1  ORF type:complete len:870 (-),score=159.75 TRINITY_DN493_c0_g1_i1:161-2770(-)